MSLHEIARRHKQCCLGSLALALFAKYVRVPRDTEGPGFQCAIGGLGTALSLSMSVADIERRHLRSKRILSHDTLFYNFADTAMLEDQRLAAICTASGIQAMSKALGFIPPIEDAPPAAALPAPPARGKKGSEAPLTNGLMIKKLRYAPQVET